MAFHEVRFPTDISFGSRGGPRFRTTVLTLTSGFEKRNRNWNRARLEFNVAYGIKTREQFEDLLEFFYARNGRLHGFRYKDWSDYTSDGGVIGTGDDYETDFQVTKIYTSGGETYTRELKKLVNGTLTGVTVDSVPQTEGVDYTVDDDTGIITFTSAPAAGQVVEYGSVEFDVPARFDVDAIEAEFEFWETLSFPSIPIIELRIADSA